MDFWLFFFFFFFYVLNVWQSEKDFIFLVLLFHVIIYLEEAFGCF